MQGDPKAASTVPGRQTAHCSAQISSRRGKARQLQGLRPDVGRLAESVTGNADHRWNAESSFSISPERRNVPEFNDCPDSIAAVKLLMQ